MKNHFNVKSKFTVCRHFSLSIERILVKLKRHVAYRSTHAFLLWANDYSLFKAI